MATEPVAGFVSTGYEIPMTSMQSSTVWPQTVSPTLKCKCGKPAAYKRVATKTAPIKGSKAVVVVEQADAVFCDDCGIVAWVK